MALVPIPLTGFESRLRFSPALSPTALPSFTAKHFPLAPTPTMHMRDGIEFEDYALALARGLLSKAFLELGEPLSWHPALRNIIEAIGKTAALSLLVCRFAG